MPLDAPLGESHGPQHNRLAWGATLVLVFVFLPAGVLKLMGNEAMARLFVSWGQATWFMMLIGLLEVTAAIAILVPRFASIAAGYLVFEMLGATGMLLMQGSLPYVLLPVGIGLVAAYTLWARIPDAVAAVASDSVRRA